METKKVFRFEIIMKGITKTFMMISNWKKKFGPHDLYKNISALQGTNKPREGATEETNWSLCHENLSRQSYSQRNLPFYFK